MDDGTTLKIEVSTGASSPSSAPASSSDPLGGKTFGEHRKDQIRATGEFNRRMQEQRMELEREKARRKNEQWMEKFEERSAKRREREEAKQEREREKAERKQEKERRKSEVADNRQERDETWYERDLQRQAKEKDRAKQAAEKMQSRDEDWYARDQRKQEAAKKQREQREWWSNPNNVAQNQLKMGERASAIRGSLSAQRLGFSAESAVTKFASSISAATFRLGPLIAVAGSLYGAWSASRKTLMDEAKRVAHVSPELSAQSVVSKFRNLRTDFNIAANYGERMAQLQDLENRRDNAWRLIGAKVADAIDKALKPISGPIEEGFTNMLEWLAGIDSHTSRAAKYLEKSLGLTKEQFEKYNIKTSEQNALADAFSNAEKIMKSLSAGSGAISFKGADEVTEALLNANPDFTGKKDGGFVPVPAWWRDR